MDREKLRRIAEQRLRELSRAESAGEPFLYATINEELERICAALAEEEDCAELLATLQEMEKESL